MKTIFQGYLKMKTIQIQTVTGSGILPLIPELAKLRIEVFREYPYLYEGDLAYEENYLKNYANISNACLIVAMENGTVVGASTGMPLAVAHQEVQAPFIENSIDRDAQFYLGESVLKHAYRGQGVGVRFFDARESHAKCCGYNIATFCAVDRLPDDSRRHIDYQPLDGFWEKRGYHRRSDLQAHFSWKEIGDELEKDHTLTFWMKVLGEVGNG